MSGIKALIIEDSPATRETIKGILESQENMEVIGAASGDDGIDALKKGFLPDFIILDINLPGKMDGADVMEKLSYHKQWKNITIFPYSAFWKEETKKPYEADLDIVKKWDKKRKQRSERLEEDPSLFQLNPVEGKPGGEENSNSINPNLIVSIALFLKEKEIKLSPIFENWVFRCVDYIEQEKQRKSEQKPDTV